MQKNKILKEKGFLSKLGKGLADFAKGFGALSAKDHKKLTQKYNSAKTGEEITKIIQRKWVNDVNTLWQRVKSRNIGTNTPIPDELSTELNDRLTSILSTVKINPDNEKYTDIMDAIIDAAISDPEGTSGKEVYEMFAQIVVYAMAERPRANSTTQGKKVRVRGITGKDADEDIIYIVLPSSAPGEDDKIRKYTRGQLGGVYSYKALSKKEQQEVLELELTGKLDKRKWLNIIQYGNEGIAIDDGSMNESDQYFLSKLRDKIISTDSEMLLEKTTSTFNEENIGRKRRY